MDTDCGDTESGINKCREGLERKTALGEKEKTLHYVLVTPKCIWTITFLNATALDNKRHLYTNDARAFLKINFSFLSYYCYHFK